jgi:hypothetical protein
LAAMRPTCWYHRPKRQRDVSQCPTRMRP